MLHPEVLFVFTLYMKCIDFNSWNRFSRGDWQVTAFFWQNLFNSNEDHYFSSFGNPEFGLHHWKGSPSPPKDLDGCSVSSSSKKARSSSSRRLGDSASRLLLLLRRSRVRSSAWYNNSKRISTSTTAEELDTVVVVEVGVGFNLPQNQSTLLLLLAEAVVVEGSVGFNSPQSKMMLLMDEKELDRVEPSPQSQIELLLLLLLSDDVSAKDPKYNVVTAFKRAVTGLEIIWWRTTPRICYKRKICKGTYTVVSEISVESISGTCFTQASFNRA